MATSKSTIVQQSKVFCLLRKIQHGIVVSSVLEWMRTVLKRSNKWVTRQVALYRLTIHRGRAHGYLKAPNLVKWLEIVSLDPPRTTTYWSKTLILMFHRKNWNLYWLSSFGKANFDVSLLLQLDGELASPHDWNEIEEDWLAGGRYCTLLEQDILFMCTRRKRE